MGQEIAVPVQDRVGGIGKKSWTAYVRFCLLPLAFVSIMARLVYSLSHLAATILLAVSLLVITMGILNIRSIYLYFDDTGIWLRSGALPWNRATFGLKWRDLDGATYYTGFSNWLFKSYSVRITHRFTKNCEIFLTDMAHGNDLVQQINQKHQDLIRTGTIN